MRQPDELETLSLRVQARQKRWVGLSAAIIIVVGLAGILVVWLTTRQSASLTQARTELAAGSETEAAVIDAYEALRISNTKQASEAAGRALELETDNLLALELSAHALMQAKRYKEAVSPLEQAVELAPQRIAPRRDLALAYWHSGNTKAAAEQVSRLYEALPDAKTALAQDSEFNQMARNPAIREMVSDAETQPEYRDLEVELGSILELWTHGEEEEAVAELARRYEEKPALRSRVEKDERFRTVVRSASYLRQVAKPDRPAADSMPDHIRKSLQDIDRMLDQPEPDRKAAKDILNRALKAWPQLRELLEHDPKYARYAELLH